MTADEYIAALEVERAGYVLRGLDDRVAEIDAEVERARDGAQSDTTEPTADADAEAEVEPVSPADDEE